MRAQVLGFLVAFIVLNSVARAATFSHKFVSGPKIDILFVIDNSASMDSAQKNLIAHLPRLIEKLNVSTVDFHVGVTTTEAYRSLFDPQAAGLARLRDGSYEARTGVSVVTRETPDLSRVLATNLNQGVWGSGNERAFSSFRAVLDLSANAEFRRPDAALSVVVVSDEDDFSATTAATISSYDDPRLIQVSDFASYLAALGGRDASFSAIAAFDEACVQGTPGAAPGFGRKVARRYHELVALTTGYQGSICELSRSFEEYAEFAVAHATSPQHDYLIRLDRAPLVDTIVVKINGRLVKSDSHDGWTYDPATTSLILHGTSVPKKGDFVSVNYDYQES